MPEEVFASYLRAALKAHGVNPDTDDMFVCGPPPGDGETFELSDEFKALMAKHGVVPTEVA